MPEARLQPKPSKLWLITFKVSLRIEKDKLIIERADESVTRGKRREKLEKARTRMHGDIGGTLRKLAR